MTASRLLWYRSRLAAMSSRERAWRAVAPAYAIRERLPYRSPARGLVHGTWPSSLAHLITSLDADATTGEAARIARGELCLWGQTITIDPLRPDWRTDPMTSAREPWRPRSADRDPKPLWELHRQQHLLPLAAGASLAGNAKWQRVALTQLLDWPAANPRRAAGPGWSSAYETAHRLVQWAWTIPLLGDVAEPDELLVLELAYDRQARFVAARPSRFSSANNHRIAEVVGLLHASAVSGDLSAWQPRWAELELRVGEQTYDDGGSREQATGYFLYVFEMLWLAGLLARSLGQPLGSIREQLERRIDWATKTGDAQLEPPPFGDDAEDRIIRLSYFRPREAREIVDRAAALLEDALVLRASSSAEPSARSAILSSGLAILRSPDDGTRIAMDVGELGFDKLAAHGHADALSVVVAHNGATILRDSGTGSYVSQEGRELLRSTAAHNTVEIGETSQAVPLGPHLWGARYTVEIEHVRLADRYDYVRARHDGYAKRFDAIHRRSVLFLKPHLIVITDRIDAAAPEDVRLHWHLMSGATPLNLGQAASLTVHSEPTGTSSVQSWPNSPRYRRWSDAPRHTWRVSGSNVLFVSVIALAASPGAVTVRRVGGVDEIALSGEPSLHLVESWEGEPEVVG